MTAAKQGSRARVAGQAVFGQQRKAAEDILEKDSDILASKGECIELTRFPARQQ